MRGKERERERGVDARVKNTARHADVFSRGRIVPGFTSPRAA